MVGDQQNPGGAGSTGSIEIYWPSNNSFTVGPPLPRDINEAAVVQVDGSFLLVGGVTCCPEEVADILRFDYDDWKWEVGGWVGNGLMGESLANRSPNIFIFYTGDGTKTESTSARTRGVWPRRNATSHTMR